MVGPVPDSEVPLLRWDAAGALGADVAVTTRHGGVSRPPYDSLNLALHVGDDADAVVENRRRAALAFGVELAELVFARQVHGAQVTPVSGADGGRGATADDDPVARVLGAVHAGWRGTAAGVVGAALDAMAERGARRERIRAFVGPAVAPERYQVTDEVVHALADAVGPVPLEPEVAQRDGPGHWLVDLVAANRQQLRRGGLRGEYIDECGVSTGDERFFSDRAARPCGRFALLARLVD
jgi:hypothetical protein